MSMPKSKRRVIKGYGFLDVIGDTKLRSQWVRDGEKYLRKQVGEPCELMEPNCFSCRMWLAWATLYSLES